MCLLKTVVSYLLEGPACAPRTGHIPFHYRRTGNLGCFFVSYKEKKSTPVCLRSEMLVPYFPKWRIPGLQVADERTSDDLLAFGVHWAYVCAP